MVFLPFLKAAPEPGVFMRSDLQTSSQVAGRITLSYSVWAKGSPSSPPPPNPGSWARVAPKLVVQGLQRWATASPGVILHGKQALLLETPLLDHPSQLSGPLPCPPKQ